METFKDKFKLWSGIGKNCRNSHKILLVETKLFIKFLCTPVQLSLRTRCLYHLARSLACYHKSGLIFPVYVLIFNFQYSFSSFQFLIFGLRCFMFDIDTCNSQCTAPCLWSCLITSNRRPPAIRQDDSSYVYRSQERCKCPWGASISKIGILVARFQEWLETSPCDGVFHRLSALRACFWNFRCGTDSSTYFR